MLSASDQRSIRQYLADCPDTVLSYPHGRSVAVYSVADEPFAYLEKGKQFLRLSLRSDPELSKLLRSKYEEVSPGHKLNPHLWNTIILSGQLLPDELTALIDHSYQLAVKTHAA